MRKFIVAVALAVLVAGPGRAQEAEEFMEQVRAKYQNIADFKADFTQVVCDAATGTCKKFEGRIEVKKPSLLRMEVKKPESQLIVCDGKNLWVHLVKDKQVVRVDLKKTNNYLVWLSPLDKLLTSKVKNGCRANGDYQCWLDIPEYKEYFKEVKILVNRETMMIEGLDVTDSGDNTAEYRFIGIKANAGIKDARFKFLLPKGATIINSD